MGAEDARAVLDRAGQLGQVISDHAVHAGFTHYLFTEFITARCPAGAEQRSSLNLGFSDVFGNGLSHGEMDADGAVAVTFLINSERGLVAILVKVPHAQAAGSGQPHAGVEISLENGAVAIIQHSIASRQAHELARAGGGKGASTF